MSERALVKPISDQDGKPRGYTFKCPGCTEWHRARGSRNEFAAWHVFYTEPWTLDGKPDGKAGPTWTFDGNAAAPTFSPSLLIYRGTHPDGEIGHPRCHLFVRDGRIQFCGDSEHPLAGQTVDMVDVEPAGE